MTYKALRRKSDKQWIRISVYDGTEILQSDYPIRMQRSINTLEKVYPEIDWSLYELVTVHVIAEDELLSDNQIETEALNYRDRSDIENTDENDRIKINWYDKQEAFISGYNLFKSQILKS